MPLNFTSHLAVFHLLQHLSPQNPLGALTWSGTLCWLGGTDYWPVYSSISAPCDLGLGVTVLQVIRAATAAGVRVVLATGKARPAAIAACRQADLEGDHLLVSPNTPGVFLQAGAGDAAVCLHCCGAFSIVASGALSTFTVTPEPHCCSGPRHLPRHQSW